MADEELRAAIRAPTVKPERLDANPEEEIEALTDVLVNGFIGKAIRHYHAKHAARTRNSSKPICSVQEPGSLGADGICSAGKRYKKGTREKGASQLIYFQSIRLVGAVEIET